MKARPGIVVLLLALAACVSLRSPAQDEKPAVDVILVTDEADAAMQILTKLRGGRAPDSTDWYRLMQSEGYRRLRERETAMGRAFTDSSFRAFLMSDTLRRRTSQLEAAFPHYRSIDVRAAGAQALRYLPPGARIVARLYPMIKPVPNTFVYGSDSARGVFLYVDPHRTAAQELNTITHELHHIGYGTVCDFQPDSSEQPALQMLRPRMSGFGEGLAMLAAAGGPGIHPHGASDTADRNRWDRDIANIASSMASLEEFFRSVVDGRMTSPDSVLRKAMTFYGVQGPWYTVGWQMASTVERVQGRRELIRTMCNPLDLMKAYNSSARTLMSRGEPAMPLWSDSLLAALTKKAPFSKAP